MSVGGSIDWSVAGRALHLRKHWALSVGVLSLPVSSQRSKVWSLWILTPGRRIEQCRAIVLIPLLLLLLSLVHARCIRIRDRAGGRRFRTGPDVGVGAWREGLSKTVAVLLLGHWLIRWLIMCIRRDMLLIDWLHVAFVA